MPKYEHGVQIRRSIWTSEVFPFAGFRGGCRIEHWPRIDLAMRENTKGEGKPGAVGKEIQARRPTSLARVGSEGDESVLRSHERPDVPSKEERVVTSGRLRVVTSGQSEPHLF